jgi:hypothetical protein
MSKSLFVIFVRRQQCTVVFKTIKIIYSLRVQVGLPVMSQQLVLH